MSNRRWEHLTSVLVDTGVFIHWFRGDRSAQHFFRDPDRTIYYTKVTRKELRHKPIRTSEAVRIKAFLDRFRLINPDEQIAGRFSELLQKYPYLQRHTPDALIAATAWEKKLPLLTLNTRHFIPITEIVVVQFIPTSVDEVSD